MSDEDTDLGARALQWAEDYLMQVLPLPVDKERLQRLLLEELQQQPLHSQRVTSHVEIGAVVRLPDGQGVSIVIPRRIGVDAPIDVLLRHVLAVALELSPVTRTHLRYLLGDTFAAVFSSPPRH